METKQRAGRNRTLTLTDDDRTLLREKIVHLSSTISTELDLLNKVIHGDTFEGLKRLPQQSVDLVFVQFCENGFGRIRKVDGYMV